MLRLIVKFSILSLAFFTLFSCSDDAEIVSEGNEEFSGIEYTTTRSGGGNGNGVGIACSFSNFLGTDIFDRFDNDQNVYAIIAGDSVDVDDNLLFSEGVSFRIFWIEEGEIETGTYEAFGMSLNIEDPENLEDNISSSFAQNIEVQLTEITEDQMIGTFSGTFESLDETQEEITGKFSVDRKQCDF